MIPLDLLKQLSGPIGKFARGLTAVAIGYKIASTYVKNTVGVWSQFYVQMQDLRREAQMSQVDIGKFSTQVISSSAAYGIALSKVANMARFVGSGINLASGNVAQLSADLQNLAELTGAEPEVVGRLGQFLFRQLELSEEQTFKVSAAISAVGRSVNVSQQEMTTRLLKAKEAIAIAAETLGKEGAVKSFAALIGSMKQAGATSEDIDKVMAKLGDRGSLLGRRFAGAGFEFTALQKDMSGVTAIMEKGGMQAAAMAEIWDNLGVTTLKVLGRGLKRVEENAKPFEQIMRMSKESVKAWVEQDIGPMERIGRVFKAFWADQIKSMNGLFGKDIKQWGRDWGFAFVIIRDGFNDMTKWIGERLPGAWAGLQKTMKDWGGTISSIGRSIKVWIVDNTRWAIDNISTLLTKFERVQRFWDELTGGANRRADESVKLITKFAEAAARAGMSNVDANALARDKIQGDVNAQGSFKGLTNRERVAAMQFGIKPQVPKSESPSNSKDPTIQVLNNSLEELKHMRQEAAEERLKQELRNSGYVGGGVGGGRPRDEAATVTAARQ